jgi:hypothetical protein
VKTPSRAVEKDRIADDSPKGRPRLSNRVVPVGIRWPPQSDRSEVGNQRIEVQHQCLSLFVHKGAGFSRLAEAPVFVTVYPQGAGFSRLADHSPPTPRTPREAKGMMSYTV